MHASEEQMEGMIDHNARGGLSLPISPALCECVLDAHLVITPSCLWPPGLHSDPPANPQIGGAGVSATVTMCMPRAFVYARAYFVTNCAKWMG
jgi:hypothetical protein